jgi:hypothetical protein
MSSKSFHLRANEVRAEAQALMQKLRAERFAASRAGKRAMRLGAQRVEAEVRPSIAIVAKPSRILASRKIRAVTEAVGTVETAVVTDAAPVREAPAVEAPVSAKPRKPRSRKPATGAAAAEASVTESCVEAQPTQQPVPEASADREPVAPAKRSRKPRARKHPAPALATEAGPGPIAAMEAVTAAEIPAASPPAPDHRAMMPISLVPSLGPGMIWRLNQLGLHTLQDLADHSTEELRGKLGPVARLVRVEAWIAFAQAA